MILGLVALAFLNGVLITLSRIFNGRLGQSKGPLGASSWNHWVGFLLLVALFIAASWPFPDLRALPVAALLGGVIGALYVTVASFVMPRLGAVLTGMLIVAGQLLTSLVIETQLDKLSWAGAQAWVITAGVVLIVVGLAVSYRASKAA